ncbi:hypothetical protein MRB53_019061 [Persea americana]|uniref:Uncharacterized protein n=1 Tax=Persea americana TaxID=3435 RepID=A0ACC2M9N6_PERAE|nr:hypothetical protein MRB53_019061 [Persea americana]
MMACSPCVEVQVGLLTKAIRNCIWVSFFFFHGNSAAATLSPVLEIFFSGAVAPGIPGPMCWLRFLHDDESNNAQRRRSTAATDPI